MTTPMRTASVAQSDAPKVEPLSKSQMLDLYRDKTLNTSIIGFFRADGIETLFLHDLKRTITKLQEGILSLDDYQRGEKLMLLFLYRDQLAKGHGTERNITALDIPPALHDALCKQKSGFEYYLNGGLFNG